MCQFPEVLRQNEIGNKVLGFWIPGAFFPKILHFLNMDFFHVSTWIFNNNRT